jgi:hypothetical protein
MGVKRFTFLFLFLILFIVFYTVQSTVSHEYLHQLIFAKYGIDSNVTYNFGPAFKEQLQDAIHFKIIDANISLLDRQPMAWTTPAWNTTNNCTESCRLLHTEVEISDNQTENIVQALFVFAMGLIVWDFFIDNEKKKRETEEDEIEYKESEEESEEVSDIPRFNIRH